MWNDKKEEEVNWKWFISNVEKHYERQQDKINDRVFGIFMFRFFGLFEFKIDVGFKFGQPFLVVIKCGVKDKSIEHENSRNMHNTLTHTHTHRQMCKTHKHNKCKLKWMPFNYWTKLFNYLDFQLILRKLTWNELRMKL